MPDRAGEIQKTRHGKRQCRLDRAGATKKAGQSRQDRLKRMGQVRADPEEHMERRGGKRQVGQYKRDSEGGMDNVCCQDKEDRPAEREGRTGQVGQDWPDWEGGPN
jgi:hypothetical protein